MRECHFIMMMYSFLFGNVKQFLNPSLHAPERAIQNLSALLDYTVKPCNDEGKIGLYF